MRGSDEQTSGMFSYLSPEQRVRPDHPLRAIRRMTDEVLAALSPRFTKMYSDIGRPSIPPEQLLRALLLQSLYTVRSERLLMEEIDYSVLFRWFVGLGMDDPIWSPTTFSKNRDRLLQSEIAAAFFDAVVDAGADGRPAVGRAFHRRWDAAGGVGESQEFPQERRRAPDAPRRSGEPHGQFPRRVAAERHASVLDRSRRAARAEGPGQRGEAVVRGACPARQSPRVGGECLRHARHGDRRTRGRPCCCSTPAARRGARSAATRASTCRSFVAAVRALGVTPHVAQKVTGSAIDGRTTRHAGYAVSQQKRKLIEQVFGWMKTVGGLRKLRHRGGALVDWIVTFTAAAYNLIRLRTLLARPA